MSSVIVSLGRLQKIFVRVTYLEKEDMDPFTRFAFVELLLLAYNWICIPCELMNA
jgi:hypothetical protein